MDKETKKLIKQTMGVQNHIEMLRKKDNYSLVHMFLYAKYTIVYQTVLKLEV